MLSEKERRVLNMLRANSRAGLTRIGSMTGIPVTTVVDIVKRLKKVVDRHTILLDFEKIGYPLRVQYRIKNPDSSVKEFVFKHPNVNTLKRMHDRTLYIECIFENIQPLMKFKDYLTNNSEVEETFVVEELQREMFEVSENIK